jgi:flavin-dependent dehydrogenase
VENLFGEGIYYALRSGELAGDAAAVGLSGGDARSAYLRGLARDVYPELSASLALRELIFAGSGSVRPRYGVSCAWAAGGWWRWPTACAPFAGSNAGRPVLRTGKESDFHSAKRAKPATVITRGRGPWRACL